MSDSGARLRAVLLGGSALALVSAPGWVQAADAGPGKKPTGTVEEVVVTARRTSENLQQVPIAVTAVTTAQIEALKPRTLLDFAGEAPNVIIGLNTAGSGASAIFVRGLGYADIEKGQNPAVGLLIDDVVIGTNTAQLIDAFDIQQVEIDRGPQGIFYGKNTTGGAISIHRSRPTHQWGLSVDGAVGDYGQHQGRIILNAPVGQTAGLKLGYSFRERGGFDYNIYTQKPYGRDALGTANVEFDWKPTPTLDLLASADFTHEYGEGTPVSMGDPAYAAYYNANRGTPLVPVSPLGPIEFNQYGSPYVPGVTVPLGLRQVASDFPDRNRLSQQRYSLNAVWDTPYGQLTSITAFIKQNDETDQDFDGGCAVSMLQGGPCNVLGNPELGFGFLHTSRPQKYDQFTEEDRFVHEFGKRAKLMVGVYYFHHDISAVQLTRVNAPPFPPTAIVTNQISGEANHSISVFGNFDLNVTDRLKLSAGVRYISEGTDYHNAYNLFPGILNVPLINVHSSASWTRPITRFSAEYRVTDQNLVYFTFSEGFRSGGFSPRGTLSEAQPTSTNYSPGANFLSFNPETDKSFEIGSKNRFLDNQLTLNLAAFYTLDDGSQAGSVVETPGYGPGTNTYIVNLPEEKIYGVELESVLRPQAAPGLSLSFSGGYLHATPPSGSLPGIYFPIGPNGQAGAPGSVYPVQGGAFAYAPSWNFQIVGDYNRDLGPGVIDFNVRYHWTDRYIIGGLGAPYYDYVNAYGLVDASISYAWKNYKLTVSGKNLGNTVYLSNTLAAVDFQGWGDPRTFLVELQAKF
jgi:iron complex outermembrane receptor protein